MRPGTTRRESHGGSTGAVPVCGHGSRKHTYCFDRTAGTQLCLGCAILYRPVLRRAIVIALVVGTILTLINQGDVLLQGHLTGAIAVKIFLTYLVPLGGSTSSALAANHL